MSNWTIERLKNKQPYIECKDLHERHKVIVALQKLGFKAWGEILPHQLYVTALESMEFLTDSTPWEVQPLITATEFLNDK